MKKKHFYYLFFKEMPFIYHLEKHQPKEKIQGNKEITKRLLDVHGKGEGGKERASDK